VLYTYGLLRFPQTAQNGQARIVGIRLEEVFKVNAFQHSLYYEKHYPGSTTLAEQRQPLLGVDENAPPVASPDGERSFLRPILPPDLAAALQRSRAAGVADEDTLPTELNRLLDKLGLPPIPGVYELTDGPELPPKLAGEPYPGLILGRDLVAVRESDGRYRRSEQYPRGCEVVLTLWAASKRSPVDPIPIKRAFRYADDSRTGIYEIDSEYVYCDFELLQKLMQMNAGDRVNEAGEVIGRTPARCQQVQIKLATQAAGKRVDAPAVCRRLEDVFRGFLADERFDLDADERWLVSRVEALTWQETQAHIIGPVEKEKILVTILFGIISLVAVALILCILYMIVLQKTRDIGIVKAIGGSSGGVAAIFVAYGLAVGVVGGVLGTLLGALVVSNINEIQEFLIRINPSLRVWDLQVYSFDRIPSEVSAYDAIWIALVAIATATFGSFAAAWRAGAMQPVEAIRYE
jgi:lipoprotein-releasing system permease protein